MAQEELVRKTRSDIPFRVISTRRENRKMEIERVNENTVKFFISYRDIEDRGFNREEIWYDREQGEELFWEMMDEAASEGDFELEGPLWIQVQAYEKGLEIIVTKAMLSQDGTKLELPVVDEKDLEITFEYRADNKGKNEEHKKAGKKHPLFLDKDKSFLVKFDNFEDAIRLAHTIDHDELRSDLYVFDDVYYMYIVFDGNSAFYSRQWQDDVKSQILEFAQASKLSIYRLQEYGKQLMKDNAFEQLKTYFA